MLRCAQQGRWLLAIDIERLRREYRAACNKSCVNPDDGPASSFEVARARGELAKLRQRQARYTYTDWRRLRDESAYWIGTVSHMSPGGINWFERAVWDAVVDGVRRRYPRTLLDVWWKYADDADALDDLLEDALRDVLAEERHALPLRDLHARQRARGLDVNPLRFKTVSA